MVPTHAGIGRRTVLGPTPAKLSLEQLQSTPTNVMSVWLESGAANVMLMFCPASVIVSLPMLLMIVYVSVDTLGLLPAPPDATGATSLPLANAHGAITSSLIYL